MQNLNILSDKESSNQTFKTNDINLILQTILILFFLALLILISSYRFHSNTWSYYSSEGTIFIRLFMESRWYAHFGTTKSYFTFNAINDYCRATYGITLHYYPITQYLFIIGNLSFIIGLIYWLILILAQRNCFVSKKTPPGIFGISFLIGGSFMLVIGHGLCLELNSDLIQLSKEIGSYTPDGNITYILSFIFSGIFLNLSAVLLALVLRGPLFIHRSQSAQPIINARRKALVKLIVSVSIIPIAWAIVSFIAGAFVSTSTDYPIYLIAMAAVYFLGSVAFGFIAGFISRIRTIVIDMAVLLAIFHFGALIGTTITGNAWSSEHLWEIALPWIGVYNTSICVILFAYIVSRLRGFRNPALLQQAQ